MRTREGIDVRVFADGMYTSVYFWGDYEPYHTNVYRRLVHPGDTVIDAGANFGWFTTCFARWVGGDGRVHAFEPVPFIADLAQETLALNGVVPRVELNRCALGDASGLMPIYTFAGLAHGHASATDLGRADAMAHVCSVRRLDDYCSDNGVEQVAFMKVDVEGFEREVFLGASGLLSSPDAPLIAFESNAECLRARGVTRSEVLGVLKSLGYTDFFTISARQGVRRLVSEDTQRDDFLAAKPHSRSLLRKAVRTNRIFR